MNNPSQINNHGHQAWQELLALSLLGTERRAPNQPLLAQTLSGRLGELLQGISDGSSEHFLLTAASVLSAYRRAGTLLPAQTPRDIRPCPPDTLPRCSPAAARRLAVMLGGERPDLISEWLYLAVQAGLRVPEELLPALLDYGQKLPDLVELLLPGLGLRGRWLAAHNPAWNYFQAASLAEHAPILEVEEHWQTGRRETRLWLLRRLVRRDLAAARRLLELTWSEDSAADRTAFLAVIGPFLTLAEEPFLEICLDDRSKEVRRAAAAVLAGFSGSNLVKSLTHRATPLLSINPGRWPLRKPRLEIQLPESCDESMQRFGIDPKPPKGQGKKNWWLQQMLSVIPPQLWSQKWQHTPQDLIGLANASDWKELLLDSWSAAALLHKDLVWAEALLSACPENSALLAVYSNVDRDDIVIKLLDENRFQEGLLLGSHAPQPYSPPVSTAIIAGLRKFYVHNSGPQADYQLRLLVELIEKNLDPSYLPEVTRLLAGKTEPNTGWEKNIARLQNTLNLRRQIAAELISNNGA